MRRVAVVGGSCCGKTTLGRRLAARLGVPHVELDALHHEAGWRAAAADDLQRRVLEALERAQAGWVVDGNYDSKLGPLVLEQADTVVWLDPPFATALRRVLVRTAARLLLRTELWNGNRETLRTVLSRDSIVLWVLRTHRRYRRQIPARVEPHPGLRVVRLRSAREARAWLAGIK